MKRGIGVAALILLGSTTAAAAQGAPAQRFDHQRHARLFPVCVTCHAGAQVGTRSLWPDPASCAACHDGTIQPRVAWTQPSAPRPSNLRFSHATHAEAVVRAGRPARPPGQACVTCHTDLNAPALAVRRAAVERCLTCHGIQAAHLAAPDAACSTCHLPLAEAPRLTREDIARFGAPPSHRQAGFGGRAHGAAARAGEAGCATCHARDFCASCHVNAPEQPLIQALAPDARSLAIAARLAAPASHREVRFLDRHGASARRTPAECGTCHARESCLSCHAANPRVAATLPAAGPGRARGAEIARRPPASHTAGFREGHGGQAAALPATCAGCHARAQCFECHRPSAASGGVYHPAGFLERHPAAAYARETSCSDCHNAQVFCAACHSRAGLGGRTLFGASYHDAKRFFLMGHGVAARQSLETCVSCHAERDCLSCHSAQTRRFNPHGPGFDAERQRKKNPEMCTACHGVSIPGGP